MINGRDRCHISTSHTLLINTIINKGVCSLQCSPVGGYPQLPPLPTLLSLLPPNFINSLTSWVFFIIIFFHLLQDSSWSCASAASMFFCLYFCHHRFHLHISLFISVAAQSFLFLPLLSSAFIWLFSHRSLLFSVRLYFCRRALSAGRFKFPQTFSMPLFNFASLWSFFYRVSWVSSHYFLPGFLPLHSSVFRPFSVYFLLIHFCSSPPFVSSRLSLSLPQFFFLCYYLLLQTLCTILCFGLICSCCHTFLTSLCALLLRILSFAFVFPPLSCAFFCLPFNLSRILFLYHFLCLHPLLVCLFLSSLSFPWFRRGLFPSWRAFTWAHQRLLFSSLPVLKQWRCEAAKQRFILPDLCRNTTLFLHRETLSHYVIFLCFVFLVFPALTSKYSGENRPLL